ncbi:zinc finger protein 93 [Culex quinquefasciatus]|uniref:zinc finger protein 93 n=1 Tax=Culex quinquefasciatus TaxID=7176 RepID=UPI0018E33E97|nr:zinc finger protein 93 [Culex quinquefasciatus]
MNTTLDSTCRLCLQTCDFNNRLDERNFREKAQDILVLHLKVDAEHISIVCEVCQAQVESFFLFKRNCRRNEKLGLNLKPTAYAIAAVLCDPEPSPHEVVSPKEPSPKPYKKGGRRYRRITDRVYKRITKEQLATCTRKELYKERYSKMCEICGKSLNSNYVEDHMNRHRGVRPYPCNALDCGAKFCSSMALRSHTARRHSDGRHPCPQCSKIFTSTVALQTHSRQHEEKTIFCEICNLGVRIPSALKTHMLVHTQQRDHKCEFCGKAFYTKHVLALHRRSHTGERPFACHVCDFSHAHRILYVKHMKKIHPGEAIRTLAEIQRMAKVQQRNATGE